MTEDEEKKEQQAVLAALAESLDETGLVPEADDDDSEALLGALLSRGYGVFKILEEEERC